MKTPTHTETTGTAPILEGTATILVASSGILPDLPPQPYTVQKTQGIWEVLCGEEVVRTFLTELPARLHAACWNAGRHPTRAEINTALAK